MERKEILAKLHLVRPRIHCLTNPVTMQDVANILLACGGSAIMAQDPEEAEEIMQRAKERIDKQYRSSGQRKVSGLYESRAESQ